MIKSICAAGVFFKSPVVCWFLIDRACRSRSRLTGMKIFQRVISRVKQRIRVLYFAHKNPELPLFARIMLVFTLGYALSPIDLIPDFIPLLGYLDDLILLPVLIWITFRVIPEDILVRAEAAARAVPSANLPKSIRGAVIVLSLWLVAVVLILLFIWRRYG